MRTISSSTITRRGRCPARFAHRARWRPRNRWRPRWKIPARIPRTLRARHQLRHRPDRLARRFCFLSREGLARLHQADHVRMSMATASCATMNDAFAVIASFPEYQTHAHRHQRIRSGRLRRLLPRTARCLSHTAPCICQLTYCQFPARAWNCAKKHGVNLEGALTWAFEFERPAAGCRFPDNSPAPVSICPCSKSSANVRPG